MATNTNTDLTEEDAADLQFPKENPSIVSENFTHRNETHCVNCYNDLSDRFILCIKCDVSICCACFASGAEFNEHKNDHNYSVLSYDFPLLENSNWTAKEELILLDGLINLGNWGSISKQLSNRSVREIKDHYDQYYISRKGSKLFPVMQMNDNINCMEPIIPYRFSLDDLQDPPRFKSTSLSYHSVAGYNAARSDFELEYDTNAEDLIANLEYVDSSSVQYNILTDIQCAIIRNYNRRLDERQRRRRIIREHGLIMQRKVVAWLHRYDTTVTPAVYDRLSRFMQLYAGQSFEYLMEGLHRAGELKMQIARLNGDANTTITLLTSQILPLFTKLKLKLTGRCVETIEEIPTESQTVLNTLTREDFQHDVFIRKNSILQGMLVHKLLCDFRKRGISTLEGARLYLNLKQNREESLKELKSFHSNSIFNLKLRSMSSIPLVSTTAKRRSAFTPLEIIGMPAYEKLLPKERELCRNVRLVPLTYLELKTTLITENNKIGHLKLLTARRLLKIDVNKTRRLYDFLAEEGYIQKPNK